ncbi:MAG: tRNA (uridine(54)-C5)-methyltransferase TrmA [Cocleimonas sp.]
MLCQVNPEKYASLLAEKETSFRMQIPTATNITVFASSPQHYRARVEFRIWHEGDASDYIMFDQQSKEKVKINSCPMALASIDNLMPKLMAYICQHPVLRLKLFEIDFLATLSGEMLVSLIYRKPIEGNQEWLALTEELRSTLAINSIIGRARKQKICLPKDYVEEILHIDGKQFHYQQIENSFTQPNAEVAQKMLHWARKVSAIGNDTLGKADLIELYCGNGNFSIALADFYQQVLATEISKTSVASARYNIEKNSTKNVSIVKMAAEEISQAIKGMREFVRLSDIDLPSYNFKTILVDPPRAGLDDLTRSMVTDFERIIYISCNPETLARDLIEIEKTHEIIETALFDQFPYTHHIESGVFLIRK